VRGEERVQNVKNMWFDHRGARVLVGVACRQNEKWTWPNWSDRRRLGMLSNELMLVANINYDASVYRWSFIYRPIPISTN
jgi:hypothetical protein